MRCGYVVEIITTYHANANWPIYSESNAKINCLPNCAFIWFQLLICRLNNDIF